MSEAFGVAKGTMSAKARQVRDLLRIDHFAPEFQRADIVAENPAVWLVLVDGLAMDARNLPTELQMAAYQRGLIPFVPALGPDGTRAIEG